jgi:hypothetical protein
MFRVQGQGQGQGQVKVPDQDQGQGSESGSGHNYLSLLISLTTFVLGLTVDFPLPRFRCTENARHKRHRWVRKERQQKTRQRQDFFP